MTITNPPGIQRPADAVGFMQKRKLNTVPSFVPEWRARRDSNPRSLVHSQVLHSNGLFLRTLIYAGGCQFCITALYSA